LGKKLIESGGKNGIRKEATLLPVHAQGPLVLAEPLWVSIDAYDQFTVQEKDGEVMVVAVGRSTRLRRGE
jgi:hypothetical protein